MNAYKVPKSAKARDVFVETSCLMDVFALRSRLSFRSSVRPPNELGNVCVEWRERGVTDLTPTPFLQLLEEQVLRSTATHLR